MVSLRSFFFSMTCVLLFLSTSFSNVDWGIKKGGASFLETRLPRTVSEKAYQMGAVAFSQAPRNNQVQFVRHLAPSTQALEWNSLSYQDLHWGFTGRLYRYEDLQGVDEFGEFTGLYGASLNDFSVNYNQEFQGGKYQVELHYLDARISQAFAQAIYLDLEFYSKLFEGWNYGWRVRNFGFSSKFDKRDIYLPIQVLSGISHPFDLTQYLKLESGLDIEYLNDEGASLLNAYHFNYSEALSFKTSIRLLNPDGSSLTELEHLIPQSAAVILKMDFGFVGYGYRMVESLGGSHTFEFGVNI